MDTFGAIRALAREKHCLVREAAGGHSAKELLGAARKISGLTVQSLPAELPQLGGGDGALHRETNAIFLSNGLTPELSAFVEAHEFGHFWIETPSADTVVPHGADPSVPEQGSPLGLRRVEAYSPQELRERLANVFAREFLLPRDLARELFITQGKNGPAIAEELGVPIGLVHQQLMTSLLLPEPEASTSFQEIREKPALDESQKLAAHHLGSPLLVEAGPGTGKTRTLIARVEFLIGRKFPAASILALTFSNKAANEIRERVALTLPVAAGEIWAGTFHAFGLEILRKYGHLADVAEPVRLIDQADALAMLEEDLPKLGLDYYLRLYEPLEELRHILGAISRAKDEVKSPDDYAHCAGQMALKARTEDEVKKAAKALEVARVYAFYDAKMRNAGWVDFADLINRPVEILKAHPEVGEELRAQYQNLLVDEYQDVNRASALLVKELAGAGQNLWVVGDARQSIYRFRGAAPLNTRDFEKDYPQGKRLPLAVNYRSKKGIVDTFGTYAGAMTVGGRRAVQLQAHRGQGNETVDYNVACDRDAEIAGIAATIMKRRKEGYRYKDQAVLCRVHGNLEKIAKGLEALNIPVLYLGDLFERPEVRDLLSILSFVAEPHRGGLYRVAALPPFRAQLPDVQALLNFCKANDIQPIAALKKLGAVPDISHAGREAFRRLSEVLAPNDFKTGPGVLLCHILFNNGDLLRHYLTGDDAAAQQRRLAIHQFLQFAVENNMSADGDPKRQLLDWVRRLEVFGDERALREPPAAVAGIDAVRLMTVHSSKGLEFKVVHLPTLGKGIFPKRRQGDRCPLPEGLLPTSVEDDHHEEEQCLFYVALSRAQDHLSLSRAKCYSDKQNSNPCEALGSISGCLPRAVESLPSWRGTVPKPQSDHHRADLGVLSSEHRSNELELFLGCGRRYLYQVALGLSGGRDDNGYVRFHRAVYQVLGWMAEQGISIDKADVAREMEKAWYEVGPFDDPLSPLYRSAADRILAKAVNRDRKGISFNQELTLQIDGVSIEIRLDEVQHGPQGLVFRRLRTGRPPSKPDQRHLHVMMLLAGRQSASHTGSFEIQYLTTDETVSVSLDGVASARLADIKVALEDIRAGRYVNDPKNPEDCPRCPHYFICPTVPV